MNSLRKIVPALLILAGVSLQTQAQVGTVEFGKNRVQYKKFKWTYYKTDNFYTYFSQTGEPLAKYVAQMAEEELPGLEKFAEYALQRRANIVLYNSFEDVQQTNIGLKVDWQRVNGGNTQLVNNKMVVYYNSDHSHLRKQIRQGIAKILMDNILFGDDLGEFAANQALLDLPKWLTDGYVSYAAENWSTQLDDDLKSALLSGSYKNFYQFAFDKPQLAGHAFWNYIANQYKKENVTYFLYLARVYRNLNTASQRICKKKFKEVLREFMETQEDKYYKDIRARRNAPKGTLSVVEEVNKFKDFFHFSPNPAPRSQTYAVVEYRKGLEKVMLYENFIFKKVLLTNGVRSYDNVPNPHYPILAWNGKGTKLAVVYAREGKVNMFVYDLLTKIKSNQQTLDEFEQVQDAKYMLNDNSLLLSAVKKGQSDIFVYDIDKQTSDQITNDVYDDLDASFVAFPGKTGIVFSSNRPNSYAPDSDTALPSRNKYNIFLIDNWNRSEFKQISQLTKMKLGDARYPVQYNSAHFTFLSDENGINNRFAGFFTTTRAGVDTIYKIGDEILRNPEYKEIDSLLQAYKKSEPDSIFTYAVTNDSAYIFPITNYQSSIVETKAAGDNGLVSETRREGDLKFLYKLKVDENALKKRNINLRPTDFRRRQIDAAKLEAGDVIQYKPEEADTSRRKDIFESEFENEKKEVQKDTAQAAPPPPSNNMATLDQFFRGLDQKPREGTVLGKAKRYVYNLKFAAEQLNGSLFNNDVLVTRYDPFTGSLPIMPGGSGSLNGMLGGSVYDLFEDIRFTGMFRLPLINTAGAGIMIGGPGGGIGSAFLPGTQSLFNAGSEFMGRFDYLKKRLDYSVVYYRKTESGVATDGASISVPTKLYTNLFQGIVKYPFDRIRSIRISAGARIDRFVFKGFEITPTFNTLDYPDSKRTYGLLRLEYVYDNSVEKTTNILNGLRYKAYIDFNSQIGGTKPEAGTSSFNWGFDARNYYPIYQNFIWAVRAAADFSWGDQKIVYYLGGTDGWLTPKANTANVPQPAEYAFQALALNMRGFDQNVANGNNAFTINSELRLPVFSTLLKKPINNAFIRNFQVVQFIDLGTAWNGSISNIERPSTIYPPDGNPTLAVRLKAGGIGPFVGGYGFGVRSTLLGYFLRFDAAWPMDVFFKGKPKYYFSMGVDF